MVISVGTVRSGVAAISLAAALLAACSPRVATRGNMVEDFRLDQIQAGVSTQSDVASILGTPTTVSTFDPSIWYYIGQRTETVAFLKPEVTDRRIVRMQFDPGTATLADMKLFSLADARQIELVQDQTPTLGRRIGILEQFLGNIGRFTNPDSAAPAGPGLPGPAGR
jgi:outer membrane protein assembly factor BamE (lipoprotein component of BamABCDE complex)